jgi:hypothetical protein
MVNGQWSIGVPENLTNYILLETYPDLFIHHSPFTFITHMTHMTRYDQI